MKISDKSLDNAFRASADKLEVPVGPNLWDRIEEHNVHKSPISILKISLGVAAGLALIITASFLFFENLNEEVVIDLAANTSSEKYNSYKDYLKSDQYAQLRTSYEGLK